MSGPASPSHEEIRDTAEMPGGLVVADSPAQVAVQGDRVEQGLQRVVVLGHRSRQPIGAVVVGLGETAGLREHVGLVVDDDEAPHLVVPHVADAHDHVDRAGEVPDELDPEEPGRHAPGPARQRVVRRQVARDERADVAVCRETTALAQPELEVQLVETLCSREIAQSSPAEQRAEGRLDRSLQAHHQARRVDGPGVPAQPVLDVGTQLLDDIGGGEIDALEHLVHESPELGPPGDRTERQVGGGCGRGACRRPVRFVGGLVRLGRLVIGAGVQRECRLRDRAPHGRGRSAR